MSRHRSLFTDTLTVHAGESHLAIAPGQVVDFRAMLAPGVTLADALGAHRHGFEVVPDEIRASSNEPGVAFVRASEKPPSRRVKPQPVSDAPAAAPTQE